jgi:hypothetical protein
VDYFSTLGYQPGIALLAAGALSPIATLILVGVTLFCAFPVYAEVAKRSYAGQGSIALLEHLLTGWWSKALVLVLLGFAFTDFVITMTLSAADAAAHAAENPFLHEYLAGSRLPITIGILVVLAIVFLKGFREAIGLAGLIAIPYLVLNVIVIGRGLYEIAMRPDVVSAWSSALELRGDWSAVALASLLIFPKLALGLSGFETGVSVMPLVDGGAGDEGRGYPAGRVRATRSLLLSAALIMSVMLIGSSIVTTLLIPPDAYASGGEASGRAIAYLAHRFLGPAFGTTYDAATILILGFAGASALAALLSLIPRYLPRFGMAPRWTVHARALVLVLLAVAIVVTLVFDADVEAQAGAYATGVLVLMLSAAVAAALALWREGRTRGVRSRVVSVAFWMVSAVFAYTLVENVVGRPDGIIISGIFILSVILVGAASRYRRATELRAADVTLADESSAGLWPEIAGKKVNLVPMKRMTPERRAAKAREIREHYAVSGPIAFMHVELIDDRSEFLSALKITVERDGADYGIHVSGAVAIANTIAYVSELVDPTRIFLGLTRRNLMSQSMRYVIWGEGETGLMVYAILVRYWEWTPEDDVRPLIFMMSE